MASFLRDQRNGVGAKIGIVLVRPEGACHQRRVGYFGPESCRLDLVANESGLDGQPGRAGAS